EDVFGTTYEYVTQTDLVEFHIDTKDAAPIYQRPYSKFSFSKLDLLKKELQEMLNNVTVRDVWVIPSIKEVVEAFKSANWLTSVDVLK
ncbi:hypothetical protein K501DRAFT_137067, partial [Backusella circina FSU 941]